LVLGRVKLGLGFVRTQRTTAIPFEIFGTILTHDFFDFHDDGRPPSWIFKRLKFRGDRSNRYLNIVIFQFSRLRLSAILDCKHFEILKADRVQCVKVRQPGEFRGDHQPLHRDFSILKMTAVRF